MLSTNGKKIEKHLAKKAVLYAIILDKHYISDTDGIATLLQNIDAGFNKYPFSSRKQAKFQ